MERAHRYISGYNQMYTNHHEIEPCAIHWQILGLLFFQAIYIIYIYISASSLDSHIGFIQNPKLVDYRLCSHEDLHLVPGILIWPCLTTPTAI